MLPYETGNYASGLAILAGCFDVARRDVFNKSIKAGHFQRASQPIILKCYMSSKVYLRSEDAFVITCVANLMEVKVLHIQKDLQYEISSCWRFNV
jgi:hypothetical protein